MNFSDRYLATVGQTTPQGASPQKIAEALRKYGVPKEQDWPITQDLTSWDKFYSPPTQDAHNKAREFLDLFTVNHEYVPTSKSSLMSALKYSPLGVAVSAWATNSEGLYVSTFPSNHWCVLVGFEEGKYWLVYDSYQNFDGEYVKKLAWDYSFGQAKRYAINIKEQNASSVWDVLSRFNLRNFFSYWWSIMYGKWKQLRG